MAWQTDQIQACAFREGTFSAAATWKNTNHTGKDGQATVLAWQCDLQTCQAICIIQHAAPQFDIDAWPARQNAIIWVSVPHRQRLHRGFAHISFLDPEDCASAARQGFSESGAEVAPVEQVPGDHSSAGFVDSCLQWADQ